MVVGVPMVHVMLLRSVVRRVRWVACGGQLRWRVVVMQQVGVKRYPEPHGQVTAYNRSPVH